MPLDPDNQGLVWICLKKKTDVDQVYPFRSDTDMDISIIYSNI